MTPHQRAKKTRETNKLIAGLRAEAESWRIRAATLQSAINDTNHMRIASARGLRETEERLERLSIYYRDLAVRIRKELSPAQANRILAAPRPKAKSKDKITVFKGTGIDGNV